MPIDATGGERVAGEREELLQHLALQRDKLGGEADVVVALAQAPLRVSGEGREDEDDGGNDDLLLLLLAGGDDGGDVLLQALQNALRQPHVRVAHVAALRLRDEAGLGTYKG